MKVGGVAIVEIGLGGYLCAPTAQNPAQSLVPSGGFRRRRKNAPQGSQHCAALIEPSAQVRRWEEGIASHRLA